jgi:hypothetical protein
MISFDRDLLADICRRNGVRRLRLFGSAAQGREGPASDVDLIVDFSAPKGFFELIRLEDELSAFFGRPVDVLTEPALSPFIKERVLESAAVIFDAAA